jgi:hypothetical protein
MRWTVREEPCPIVLSTVIAEHGEKTQFTTDYAPLTQG